MVRRCQRGFGQQESEQDECRSKISPHDLLRASNDTVPPTSLDVGDGGQFSAVVTTDIGRYYRYKCMPPSEHHHDFPHILPENCAELTWGLDCRKAPGSERCSMSRLERTCDGFCRRWSAARCR